MTTPQKARRNVKIRICRENVNLRLPLFDQVSHLVRRVLDRLYRRQVGRQQLDLVVVVNRLFGAVGLLADHPQVVQRRDVIALELNDLLKSRLGSGQVAILKF